MGDWQERKGQTVLVTGGSGTLGSAIVTRLRLEGYPVVATYHTNAAKAQELCDATGCTLHSCDLSEETQVRELFRTYHPHHTVHCAGVNSDALMVRQSVGGWHGQWKNNAQTAFLVVSEALRSLPAGGHLLVLGSRVGRHGFAGQSAYAAAKGAVEGLVVAAALEGRHRNLVVNLLFPPFVPSALSSAMDAGVLAKRFQQNLIPTDVLPDSVAPMSCMADSLAGFVAWEIGHNTSTGQVFCPDCRVEGGS